jgi:hypothetical protein
MPRSPPGLSSRGGRWLLSPSCPGTLRPEFSCFFRRPIGGGSSIQGYGHVHTFKFVGRRRDAPGGGSVPRLGTESAGQPGTVHPQHPQHPQHRRGSRISRWHCPGAGRPFEPGAASGCRNRLCRVRTRGVGGSCSLGAWCAPARPCGPAACPEICRAALFPSCRFRAGGGPGIRRGFPCDRGGGLENGAVAALAQRPGGVHGAAAVRAGRAHFLSRGAVRVWVPCPER